MFEGTTGSARRADIGGVLEAKDLLAFETRSVRHPDIEKKRSLVWDV